MIWLVVMQVISTLVECLLLEEKSEREKDLEILLLRRQLAILDRQRGKPIHILRGEKVTLVVLTARLRPVTGSTSTQPRKVIRGFQPETILKWHRELVRRKWTFRRQRAGGRPRTNRELKALIVRLARENRDWGNLRIQGEHKVCKERHILRFRVSKTTQHETGHGEISPTLLGARQEFIIFAETTLFAKPGKGAFDHPTAGQESKAFSITLLESRIAK